MKGKFEMTASGLMMIGLVLETETERMLLEIFLREGATRIQKEGDMEVLVKPTRSPFKLDGAMFCWVRHKPHRYGARKEEDTRTLWHRVWGWIGQSRRQPIDLRRPETAEEFLEAQEKSAKELAQELEQEKFGEDTDA